MKKYLMILLVGIISFFSIDDVIGANITTTYEGNSYKSDTCVLQEQTGNMCNYHCIVNDDSDNYFEFDYKVENITGISATIMNIVIGGSDCSVFPYQYKTDYYGNKISDKSCSITMGSGLGKGYYSYFGSYNISDAVSGIYIKDGQFRCPSVYADVSTTISDTIIDHTANRQFVKSFGIRVLKDETQLEEDAKDFIENEDVDKCAIFGENLTPYVKSGIKIIRILVAVIFAAMSIIDFLKVVMTGEDKSYKEALGKFIKRLIIVVIIEVLPVLIALLIKISGILGQYNIQGDIYCSLF